MAFSEPQPAEFLQSVTEEVRLTRADLPHGAAEDAGTGLPHLADGGHERFRVIGRQPHLGGHGFRKGRLGPCHMHTPRI